MKAALAIWDATVHGSCVHTADVTVRAARPGDETVLFGMIRELAVFERLEHLVTGSSSALARDLFAPEPRVSAVLAELDAEVVGYALFFSTYSTFRTQPGIYLEDLFVREAHRRRGIGRRLLQAVARAAVEQRAGRVEWAVLDWNHRAMDFYRAIGASVLEEWRLCRLTGTELSSFGSAGSSSGEAP